MKMRFFIFIAILLLAGYNADEYNNRQAEPRKWADSTQEAPLPSDQSAQEQIDFGIPVMADAIPYSNMKCIAVDNNFYLIDDGDASVTLYKINELGEVVASTCLTETKIRIRIKPMGDNIALLTHKKIVLLDLSLNIIEEIELPDDIGEDGFDYDVDTQLNYLYMGTGYLDLKTGEFIELFPTDDEKSTDCYRVVDDTLLCVEYYKDTTRRPEAFLFDLNEKKKTPVPFNGDDIVPSSFFSLQYNLIPTFGSKQFDGVYNVKENSYTKLNISNQLAQKSCPYGWDVQMNSQNLFYIDENLNLVKFSLETLESTTTGFHFTPAEKIWLLAANQNDSVLYYTNSPDAGDIKLYIATD